MYDCREFAGNLAQFPFKFRLSRRAIWHLSLQLQDNLYFLRLPVEERIFCGFLTFLYILHAEALTVFVPDYFFKDVGTANSLGRQRSKDQACLLSSIIKIMGSVWSKVQISFLPTIRDSGFLKSGLRFSVRPTEYASTHPDHTHPDCISIL